MLPEAIPELIRQLSAMCPSIICFAFYVRCLRGVTYEVGLVKVILGFLPILTFEREEAEAEKAVKLQPLRVFRRRNRITQLKTFLKALLWVRSLGFGNDLRFPKECRYAKLAVAETLAFLVL